LKDSAFLAARRRPLRERSGRDQIRPQRPRAPWPGAGDGARGRPSSLVWVVLPGAAASGSRVAGQRVASRLRSGLFRPIVSGRL
jgi:hypothetical protein